MINEKRVMEVIEYIRESETNPKWEYICLLLEGKTKEEAAEESGFE